MVARKRHGIEICPADFRWRSHSHAIDSVLRSLTVHGFVCWHGPIAMPVQRLPARISINVVAVRCPRFSNQLVYTPQIVTLSAYIGSQAIFWLSARGHPMSELTDLDCVWRGEGIHPPQSEWQVDVACVRFRAPFALGRWLDAPPRTGGCVCGRRRTVEVEA